MRVVVYRVAAVIERHVEVHHDRIEGEWRAESHNQHTRHQQEPNNPYKVAVTNQPGRRVGTANEGESGRKG